MVILQSRFKFFLNVYVQTECANNSQTSQTFKNFLCFWYLMQRVLITIQNLHLHYYKLKKKRSLMESELYLIIL